ncbi:Metalloendopeptidase mitochondrial [Temnothorax longispinosus]|uniref:Metalloendopeptidase mitochondrial n=1 Tax=Temnothorax longispinosus TaxID=300112 RepID=A0A4S2KDT8_9HYME|nr:Metalloendopeptidase mitochondrial [Temnothorax longispinosus]
MLAISRSLCRKNFQRRTTHFVTCSVRDRHHIWSYKRFLVQDKVDCGKIQYLKLQKCDFRTTQNLHVPPLVAMLLRPILRIGAVLMGRGMKRWWTRKPEKEKEEYKQWFRERRNIFLGCFGLYGLILAIYYVTHLETDPLTQRSRFIIFNQEQEKKLGKMVLEAHLEAHKLDLVPHSHPAYKRLIRVIERIFTSNKDLKSMRDTQWTLTVINTPLTNSYILPGGNIFVSLDILRIIENDDQLGIVLAHEMAHSLLLHSLEALSDRLLWDFLIAIPILLVWAIFPDLAAAIIHMIGERIVNIIYNLPFSRVLENEADEVGLKLAAKACIDIREAVVFWATMRTLTEMHTLPPELPWISTHPAHGDREKRLNEAMTKALELRKDSGCSTLPAADPRDKLLIGAPRGNYTRHGISWRDTSGFKFLDEPGVVYLCSLPGPCMEIRPTISAKDEELYIRQLNMRAYVKKEHSWFGGAMSVEKNSGFLTVAVVNLNGDFVSLITNLRGTDIGEFFGASLASGDLNSDGLHDLVVGAPHWGNDNGRIYIYLGSSKKEFETAAIIKGTREDAQFGYAVAIGDVDGDGFGDIIVGAPWEDSGAIYVYNGDASLKDNIRPTLTQRITMQFSSPNLPAKGANIQSFGFSISEPIDIDNNGYADIAVGAYKSGHVVVLRNVYKPQTLHRNNSSFLIEACVEYHSYDIPHTHTFKVSFIVDKKYKRSKETSLDVYSMDAHTCVNATITLSDNIQNFIEPITIYASHDFTCNDSSEFCKTCPIESRNARSRSAQILLPFDIGCGDDRVCNSSIHAIMKFWGIRQVTFDVKCNTEFLQTKTLFVIFTLLKYRENNTWVIGSNDITLETSLKNFAEPAYLTTIVFTLPKEIVLRSILPFCEEDTDDDTLTVICNVGNPLGMYEEILKFGVTPIEEARLVINLPISINDSDSLVLLYEPRIYISGRYYNCLSNGVDLVDVQQDELSGETVSDASDLYNPNYNNETLQNATHNVFKRNADSHVAFAARILQTLYNMRMTRFEDSNDNLTVRERNIVYVNCSTYGVNCSTIYCDLNALRTQQDVGKLTMRLILNATRFKDNFKLSNEMKIVKFSTDAHVEIIKPANRIFGIDESAAKTQKLQLWVVIASISLGLILLCIVIIILNTVGFFKRTTKEELFALNSDEVTEDAEKGTSE